jgi:hypothetical protein
LAAAWELAALPGAGEHDAPTNIQRSQRRIGINPETCAALVVSDGIEIHLIEFRWPPPKTIGRRAHAKLGLSGVTVGSARMRITP